MKFAGILTGVVLCLTVTLQALAQVTGTGQDKPKPPQPQTFRLDNGLTVTLLENHKEKTVAVESFYPAGFIHEPAGKAHISHVTEHMFILSATRSYKAHESFELLQKKGLVNAETLATVAHYDYVLPSGDLELALQIESERLTSIEFSEDVLATEVRRCLEEVESVQRNPQAGLVKFGLVGLNQALRAGADVKAVSIGCGAAALTVEDIREFHRHRYTPERARLIIVGDFEPQTARELVNKHFAGIPRGQQQDSAPERLSGDVCAEWDAGSDALYLIYPYDGKTFEERVSLELFAGCLAMRLMADKGMRKTAKVSCCSNRTAPVGELPLFVFAEAKQGESIDDVRATLKGIVQGAVTAFTPAAFSQAKFTLAVSIGAACACRPGTGHDLFLGQSAINLGMNEELKHGMSDDEFAKMLKELDFETADKMIKAIVSEENGRQIVFKAAGK